MPKTSYSTTSDSVHVQMPVGNNPAHVIGTALLRALAKDGAGGTYRDDPNATVDAEAAKALGIPTRAEREKEAGKATVTKTSRAQGYKTASTEPR